MGEDSTGRTLTEELCFMLFFGLNRGKRHFLMTGGLPSGTSICNTEAHDRWQRESWAHDSNKKTWFYITVKVLIRQSIKHLKSRRRNTVCRQTALQTRCWHQRTCAWNGASRHNLHPQNHLTHHLRFFLFLLYCSEETLFLLFFGWLRGVQDHSIWASPENKTKCTEHDVPAKNEHYLSTPNKTWQFLLMPQRHVRYVKSNVPINFCLTEQ